ncbi:MAG: hypothetical protein IJJ33_01775 [Victivallales bacterium]|nr:hypothetical protein [Victivallales bacterium]
MSDLLSSAWSDLPFARDCCDFSLPAFSPSPAVKAFALLCDFQDAKGLLDTALASVRRYLKAAGHIESQSSEYRIAIQCVPTSVHEAYRIECTEASCTIMAADTEGVRRGLYEFEDLLCANGGALPLPQCALARKPFLKTRLGRCPFSPIKRNPINVDELLEEYDYYPDALLDRMAHDGINAIWIVAALRELGVSSLVAEDPKRARRIAKLKRTAAKCGRYGIKVYLLTIEPFGVDEADPLFLQHREMFAEAPDANRERYGFCPWSPLTRRYLRELLGALSVDVPELGGVINITLGERTTTCLPMLPQPSQELPCMGKCGKNPGEILQSSLAAMVEGLREGSPHAELIAWFYIPQPEETAAWCRGLSEYMPKGVVPMFNFESGGCMEQLGKLRYGGDYWLSYEGPAPRFAEEAKCRKGQSLGAKLQISDFGLAAVPCVPIPSMLRRKCQALAELGCTHLMHSWYVGNFPTIMSSAVGLAVFREEMGDGEGESEFLLRLARPVWRGDSTAWLRAWRLFDEAYQNFPFNVMFQYYSPVNNMTEWRFHFLPDLMPLAMPWKPDSIPGGDAVGEAMGSFSLKETIALLHTIVETWGKGVAALDGLAGKYAPASLQGKDLGVANFILLQFRGALNLLRFYELRRMLYTFNERDCLERMKAVVREQQGIFRCMIPLLENDSRLGFHGEALKRVFDENSVRRALQEAELALALADEMAASPLSPREQALERGVWRLVEPQWRQAGPRILWTHAVCGGELIVRLRFSCPKEGELMFWFMDACGCCTPLIEFLECRDGTLVYRGNSAHLTEGIPRDTEVVFRQCADDEWLFRWKLAVLPDIAPELPWLKFNIRLRVGQEIHYAFGTGTTYRLLLGHFNPGEGGCLAIDLDKR